jgi:response regulator RpfG family c-di-GMP phosphodiesterase
MSLSGQTKPPLIIDPDKDFLKQLADTRDPSKPAPITKNTGKDGQLLIANLNQELSAIFVNPAVLNPGGISVIRSAHQHRPSLPVYVIYDQQPPFSAQELKQLGIQKAIQKPIAYEQIVDLITPAKLQFNAENAVASGQMFTDQVGAEISSDEADFTPIRADDFLAGAICFFDVYVRLPAGKYIKILQSGDHFSTDRIEGYLKKGVTHLHIRKEMQKHYLAFCDKLATAVIHSQSSIDVKVSQSLNHGEEVVNYLQENGVDSENVKFASQFLQNTQLLVKQLELDKQPTIQEFLNDVTAYDHAVGVSMIAALLFRPLKITSADPIEIVGLASLFHDIGLRKLDPPILVEDESIMTDAQKAVYQTHPVVGATLLTGVKGIKPIIIQAISQHHERRTKKGFPDRIGAGSISIVAEIVGLSDEYYRFLVKQKEGKTMNVKFYLEHRLFNAFSNQLVTEFKKVFRFDTPPDPKSK